MSIKSVVVLAILWTGSIACADSAGPSTEIANGTGAGVSPRGQSGMADTLVVFLRDGLDGDGIIRLAEGEIAELDAVLTVTASEAIPGALWHVYLDLIETTLQGPDHGVEVVDLVKGLDSPWDTGHPYLHYIGFDYPFPIDDYDLDFFDSSGIGLETIDGTIELLMETLVIRGLSAGTYEITFSGNELAHTADFDPYETCDPCSDPLCEETPGTLILGTGDFSGCSPPLIIQVFCPGDVNTDRTVDPLDSGFVMARLGCSVGTGDPECDDADANLDGEVDPLDLGYVLARFGDCFGLLPQRPTERVSLSSAGAEANGNSLAPVVSAEGRFVAFESEASNLVDDDTNAVSDVFVFDRKTGTIQRVSVASGGAEGNAGSQAPSISPDGRFVAFESLATNLVDGDSNDVRDIFVHDRQTETTTRVSIGIDGIQSNGTSSAPSISADGCRVAFDSDANNLVADDTNAATHVFVHDQCSGLTLRVSVSSTGEQGDDDSRTPAMAADGYTVAFVSEASNLVHEETGDTTHIFVHDLFAGITERVSIDSKGEPGTKPSDDPTISGDGLVIAFHSHSHFDGDANLASDIYVHDRETGITKLVSVASDGTQGNETSYLPAISADGRFILFHTEASNVADGDVNWTTDIFLHDRITGTTELVTVSPERASTNGPSFAASLSPDGAFAAFYSDASDLVADDQNDVSDVFVVDLSPTN